MARSETLPQAMGGRVVEPVAIVTVLALLQYFFFGYQVGAARIRYDVAAPATTGHPLFERNFRIHQNTLEQLIAFLPGLWLFGWYVHALVAAALGLLFIAGRFVYRASYLADPASRTLGVATGGLAIIVLLLGGLVGAIVAWI
jgi:uncharacterized MAPEG superfamily protein